MPKEARIPSPHAKSRDTRTWDVPTGAWLGAKLGILVTLVHHLHHTAYDSVLEETFLTHRLVELIGFPCAGLILGGSAVALYNVFVERQRGVMACNQNDAPSGR